MNPLKLKPIQRVVVKVGSALLTPNGPLGPQAFTHIAQGISDCITRGIHIALVSSGAIAQGRLARGLTARPRRISTAQALAALGQPLLMQRWAEALKPHSVAQVLLTQSDIDDPTRFFNARRALEALERAAIIPIGNENDTVATDEIKIGDNDTLAAHIARVVNADLLILLTQVDGLYTANPEEDRNAEKVSLVTPHDEVWGFASQSSKDGWGRGGMRTKLSAAEIAGQAGIPTVIAHGATPIPELLNQPSLGTLFLPHRSPSEALRDRWPVCGELWVTEAGSTAIFSQQCLELTHIQRALGSFSRGDVVELCSVEYGPIGRSLVAYGDAELRRVIKSPADLKRTPESLLGENFDGPVCTPRDWALTYSH